MGQFHSQAWFLTTVSLAGWIWIGKSVMHLILSIGPLHNQILHLEGNEEKRKNKPGSNILKRLQCHFRYDATCKSTRQQGNKVRMRDSIIRLHSYLGSLCKT